MDVLITGANGFVGSHLVPYLDREGDNDISALVRRPAEARFLLKSGADRLLRYRDFPGKRGFHTYVHLAGKAHDLGRVSREEEEAYFEVNTGLTRRMYDRFLEDPKARKFVFVSSVKAVADAPEEPVDEDMPPHPGTAYGISKLEAENYIREHRVDDKDVWILRPCMIHGSGGHGNLRALYNYIARGLPWPLASFENRRSYLFVDNFCFAAWQVLEDNVSPGTWHLADSQPLSTNRLVEMMAASAGLKYRSLHLPQSLVRAGAAIGDVLRLPVNREVLSKLTGDYVVPNTAILEELGREDFPITAEDGLWHSLDSMN